MWDLRKPPIAAAVHDLSGMGRCSLTVIIPVLSAMGVQVCPLPTALLSTHTGGYEGYTFLDLTDEIPKIAAHWDNLGVRFDAVYTGFLGSSRQIMTVRDFALRNKRDGALFFADPVMGDDGSVYATYTQDMCAQTAELVRDADFLTPNLTEASLLLKMPYREDYTLSETKDLLAALCGLGPRCVVLTGLRDWDDDNRIGAAYLDHETGDFGFTFTERVRVSFPGTGDVFASVLLARLLNGSGLAMACRDAVRFVYQAAAFTQKLGTPAREGLAVEGLWNLLPNENCRGHSPPCP